MLPESIAAALQTVLAGLDGLPVLWALTGSASFAIRGLPFEPNDIDLQTDKAGAYAIEAHFSDLMEQPVTYRDSGHIRSHPGSLSIDGVKVEIIGDVQKRLPEGSWSPLPRLEDLIRTIPWEGYHVPVLPLDYEVEAYRLMGRREKAAALAAFHNPGDSIP